MKPQTVPIRLPDLGLEDAPARVSTWLTEPGESVLAGDRVVEVLVPGMTFDVAAPASGTLESVVRPADSLVFAGDILGMITAAESDPELPE